MQTRKCFLSDDKTVFYNTISNFEIINFFVKKKQKWASDKMNSKTDIDNNAYIFLFFSFTEESSVQNAYKFNILFNEVSRILLPRYKNFFVDLHARFMLSRKTQTCR